MSFAFLAKIFMDFESYFGGKIRRPLAEIFGGFWPKFGLNFRRLFWVKFSEVEANCSKIYNFDQVFKVIASRTRFFHVQAIKTGHISVVYRQYIVGFQRRHCSSKVTDENFKITLEVLEVLTPKFLSNPVSALWQCITLVMQGLK